MRASPAGRLPYTIVRSEADLPPFADYSMQHRTYRYFNGPVLHPFGHGLAYTTFSYAAPKLSATRVKAGQAVKATVTVRNTGRRDSDEVDPDGVVDRMRSSKAWARRLPAATTRR